MRSGATTKPALSRARRLLAFPHEGSRFASLEAYRAIAAMMVVVYHVAGTRTYTYSDALPGRLLSSLGSFGVCIFLLLSGFLLFHPFVRAHFRDTPPRDLKVYFRHRLLRIVPAYWIALTLSLMLIPVGIKGSPTPEFSLGTYLKLYFLVGNFTKGLSYSGLAVAWTLHLEVVFYLCLPLLAWIARRGFGRFARTLGGKVRANLLLLAIMVVISVSYRLGINADKLDYRGIWFPNYLDWFAAGMLLAVMSNWQDLGGRLPRVVTFLAEDTARCWLIAGSVFVAVAALSANGFGVHESDAQLLARFDLAAVGAFILLVPAALGRNEADWLKRVFTSIPFAFVGMISYGLYLYHAPVIFKIIHTEWWDSLDLKPYTGFWLELAVILPPSILIAAVSYYLVEKPLMRFKNPRKRAAAYTVVSSGDGATVGLEVVEHDAMLEALPPTIADEPELVAQAG